MFDITWQKLTGIICIAILVFILMTTIVPGLTQELGF